MPASLVEGAGVQGLPLVIGRVTKAILLPSYHSHIFPLELGGGAGDLCFILTCFTSLMSLVGSWRHVNFLTHTAQKPMAASFRASSCFTLGSTLQPRTLDQRTVTQQSPS